MKLDNKWKPLIDLLMDVTDENGQGMSEKDIREEIGTFMFGGHDTTSASMCWFVYLMAAHPEHQVIDAIFYWLLSGNKLNSCNK